MLKGQEATNGGTPNLRVGPGWRPTPAVLARRRRVNLTLLIAASQTRAERCLSGLRKSVIYITQKGQKLSQSIVKRASDDRSTKAMAFKARAQSQSVGGQRSSKK